MIRREWSARERTNPESMTVQVEQPAQVLRLSRALDLPHQSRSRLPVSRRVEHVQELEFAQELKSAQEFSSLRAPRVLHPLEPRELLKAREPVVPEPVHRCDHWRR